jgi:SAM-dependent methyltransferase
MAAGPADRASLLRALSGSWLAQCCYAMAKLGIPDLLAGGPRSAGELAAGSGTDPRALRRVLRALAGAGILAETPDGDFALTPLAEPLRSGVPRSSRDAAIMFGEEVFRSFTEIIYTLETGRPAFDKVYGMPFYDYLEQNPQAADTFSVAMATAAVPAALATCDLAGVGVVVDVGGGAGGLLARVLRAHPQARGILLDLPQAVAHARARLQAAGVLERVRFVPGSFFDTMPEGADAYVLCRVLHNWPDSDALRLLRKIRAAMAPGGRLIVLEELVGEAGERAAASPMDLLLLVMLSGWDRTEAEYAELLAAAGFTVTAVRPPPLRARQAESVIEAACAPGD